MNLKIGEKVIVHRYTGQKESFPYSIEQGVITDIGISDNLSYHGIPVYEPIYQVATKDCTYTCTYGLDQIHHSFHIYILTPEDEIKAIKNKMEWNQKEIEHLLEKQKMYDEYRNVIETN